MEKQSVNDSEIIWQSHYTLQNVYFRQFMIIVYAILTAVPWCRIYQTSRQCLCDLYVTIEQRDVRTALKSKIRLFN
jgi:hypothetical protein